MKKIHSFLLEVSIHPITQEFSDSALEAEYRKCCFRSFKHIVQIGLAMLIAIVGLYFSLFPQYGMLNMLMYVGAVFVSVWSIAYTLERRQRKAFLKRKDAELNKAHIARALNKLAQQNL